ncbi:CoA transferase [Limibacter armeniacum]|uniref:CaiB/BaiF CoA transferase family protein n=1 Tax=Limibacter armeniacum TaxID=466084 RepID=UPI002FE5C8D8
MEKVFIRKKPSLAMQDKPLSGIRVLDLTWLLPGPLCTLHLADMGADVIKVEAPLRGDYARLSPPFQKNNSSLFLAINRNKRSITLDLKSESGKEAFQALCCTSDVIVEGFRPGTMKKLGLDYASVKAIKPDIIYCSITGFGQDGPYAEMAGHDLNFCAYSGLLQPNEDVKPAVLPFQVADIVGGTQTAAMGILAAIIQKLRTGEGQYLDVSMMDGVMSHQAINLTQVKSEQQNQAFVVDLLSGNHPCYAIYETADGKYLALAAIELKFWQRFCECINRDEWINQHPASGKKAKEITDELKLLFLSKSQEEWLLQFEGIDCCLSPVLTMNGALEIPQIKARKMVCEHSHPIEGQVIQFSFPIKSSAFEFEVYRPAPQLGEHTAEILNELNIENPKLTNQ